MFSIGSIFWFAFTHDEAIRRADEIDPKTMELFRKFYGFLLDEGIYLGPSGYEVGFVSAAHDKNTLSESADRVCAVLDRLFNE